VLVADWPPLHRAIVAAVVFGRMGRAETAEYLDCSRQTVWRVLKRVQEGI
jgi:DNA-directed RNA polymerase specialized sigma24 family protein